MRWVNFEVSSQTRKRVLGLLKRDLLCLEISSNVCKPVKWAVNKDRSSIGRQEILLSYRMCGKAVKEEVIRVFNKTSNTQLNIPQTGLCIFCPVVT